MNVRIGVPASLICWGVLTVQTSGSAPQSQDQLDALRQETSELKSLVVKLAKDLEAMEKRVADLELRVQSAVVVPIRPMRIDKKEAINVNEATMQPMRLPFDSIDEGMMIDALESEMRIERKLEGELHMRPLFKPRPTYELLDEQFAPDQRSAPERANEQPKNDCRICRPGTLASDPTGRSAHHKCFATANPQPILA